MPSTAGLLRWLLGIHRPETPAERYVVCAWCPRRRFTDEAEFHQHHDNEHPNAISRMWGWRTDA